MTLSIDEVRSKQNHDITFVFGCLVVVDASLLAKETPVNCFKDCRLPRPGVTSDQSQSASLDGVFSLSTGAKIR